MKKITFINIEISSIAHAQLVEELHDVDSALEYVIDMLANGYKVSMQLDPRTENWSCYVTDRQTGSPNVDCCMGAWAGTLDGAIEKVAIALMEASRQGLTWQQTKDLFAGRAGHDREQFEQFLAWKRAQDES